jgi:hypothetical protein
MKTQITDCNATGTNWKRDIKLEPTYEDFDNAWRTVFEYSFNECTVLGVESGINTGFTVQTPKGMCKHGGFGDHIENPRLNNHSEIYYEGCGCTWDTDLDGVRYHKLDKNTNMPVYFEEACAVEVIRRYIANNQNRFPLAIKATNQALLLVTIRAYHEFRCAASER